MDPDTALLPHTRFPVTLWPPSPIPELPVGLIPSLALNGAWIVDTSDYPDGSRRLPADFVLRTAQTVNFSHDATPDEGVVAFYATFGAPRSLALGNRASGPEGAIAEVNDARAELQRVVASTLHWIAALEGGDVVEPWRVHGVRSVETELEAWEAFEDVLERGLAPFAPRVTVHYPNPFLGVKQWPEHLHVDRTIERERRVHLVDAMCRDLYNFIAEQRPLRKCPACGIRFVRHIGDARHGQHRKTGVAYCSTSCRNKERQRRYRARKKAQAEPSGGQG